MARAPVPSIMFDPDEIIATRGACFTHLQEHMAEAVQEIRVRQASRAADHRMLVRICSLSVVAIIVGFTVSIFPAFT